MMKWMSLIFGSCLGGVARYALSGFVYQVAGAKFPYGTLAVNSLGCLLIGFLAILAEDKFLLGPNARLFLMVGFCGAFTTFSTFMLETSHLMREGETLYALANVLGSVLIGFLFFRIGVFIADFV